jgi:hypothetical protein
MVETETLTSPQLGHYLLLGGLLVAFVLGWWQDRQYAAERRLERRLASRGPVPSLSRRQGGLTARRQGGKLA